eukprot:6206976-Pleurochrysis_carterae.AAC.1
MLHDAAPTSMNGVDVWKSHIYKLNSRPPPNSQLVRGWAGPLSASEQSSSTELFRARWRPEAGHAVAAAAQGTFNISKLPSRCSFAVVGAGWGGVYAAWRLGVDTGAIDPAAMCVFEANGRVGGRVYSLRGLPDFDDLAIDVGGYRFIESDLLPAQLVWKALKLPTACYDWACSAQCEGANCYVVKDAYGNNFG